THDRLCDVATRGHAPISDDLRVHARLVEVTHARGAGVGDRGRLGDADAEHAACRACVPGADADEHAGRAGAHEMQGRLIGGATTHDHGDVELAYEPLEVERLDGLRHVLSGNHRALDHE